MYDTRDLIKRSERCLSCHLGTSEKFVDHEMIAAGHPDLTFELNLFSAVMPRHWKEPADNGWRGVQEWGVGEAVQLQKGLERLARRAGSSTLARVRRTRLLCLPPQPHQARRQLAPGSQVTPDAHQASPHGTSPRYVVFRHIAKR